MPKLYEHSVTVDGNTAFPIDMLRYDALSPDSETDSHRIRRSLQYEDRATRDTRQPITLRRWAERSWRPTEGRWSSFCWKVLSHTVRYPI